MLISFRFILLISLLSCGKNSAQKLESQIAYQFADPSMTYLTNIHTGFSQYKTQSLKNSNKIALTFDDGPDLIRTPKILDLLKKENLRATFFVLGHKIDTFTKPLIKRILSEGHHLASHDFDHQDSNTEGELQFSLELKESIVQIEELELFFNKPQREMFYRFPYGAYGTSPSYHHFELLKDIGDELYGDNCLNFVFWDIDTVDWLADMSAEDVSQNVMANLKGGTAFRHIKKNGVFVKEAYQITQPYGGGVVLLHDVHDRTVKALEILLGEIKKNKIEVVTLSSVSEYSYNNIVCEYL